MNIKEALEWEEYYARDEATHVLASEVRRLREELRSYQIVTTDLNSVIMLRRCEQLQAEVERLRECIGITKLELFDDITLMRQRAENAEAKVERLREELDNICVQIFAGTPTSVIYLLAHKALERL
jgi:seryl-tRNA synthetase